jgi:hypothetical protein
VQRPSGAATGAGTGAGAGVGIGDAKAADASARRVAKTKVVRMMMMSGVRA